MSTKDWRLPENRRELFQRTYTFSLKHQNFPGMVYSMLPAIADHFELDDDGRAWLAWLNGNSQNAVSTYLLLEKARHPRDWEKALHFFNENFKAFEWDTDRRHQKAKFTEATERWVKEFPEPGYRWQRLAELGWKECWKASLEQPYMGRISAWSMLEFAKIMFPEIPDVEDWFLKASSSRSHRNSLSMLLGYDDAWHWDGEDADIPAMLDLFPALHDLAEDLLAEAKERNPGDPNVTRLTMESALCTFKSMHKPNRRYPNVYADMMYNRIKKAETRFNRELPFLWEIREETLPIALRLEHQDYDLGLDPVKQNWFREHGEVPMMCVLFEDMKSGYDTGVYNGSFGHRKDPKW
jgi:hypothetical protein